MPDSAVIQNLGLPGVDKQSVVSAPEAASEGGRPSDQQLGAVPVPKAKDSSSTPQQPFVLSEGLAPVPTKLVDKIIHGDFVDMGELLRDKLDFQHWDSV